MKYIGIVGSRRRNTFVDHDLVVDALEDVYETGDVMVSGGCKQGADSFAKDIHLNTNGAVRLIEFLPDSQKREHLIKEKNVPHRAAHAIVNNERNTLIAERSDILIACVASDRKGGTEDTIKKFLKKINLTEAEAIERSKLILL